MCEGLLLNNETSYYQFFNDDPVLYQLINYEENHNVRIANKSFENMATFRYFGKTITNQNCIQVKITSRSNSKNAYYHLVQNLLSYCLTSKSTHMKLYRTTTFPLI